MNYQQIQVFIKYTLEKPIKLNDFTPKSYRYRELNELEKPSKWKELTPCFYNLLTNSIKNK